MPYGIHFTTLSQTLPKRRLNGLAYAESIQRLKHATIFLFVQLAYPQRLLFGSILLPCRIAGTSVFHVRS